MQRDTLIVTPGCLDERMPGNVSKARVKSDKRELDAIFCDLSKSKEIDSILEEVCISIWRLIPIFSRPSGTVRWSILRKCPAIAADALEAGFDGPALRRLAGLIKPTSRDIGKLFDEALEEIGDVKVRSKEQAIFKLAKTVAQAIVDGQIDPIQGAQRLSHYAMEARYPAGLAEFDQLADEPLWGDNARNRDSICADIVAEARKLIASVPA